MDPEINQEQLTDPGAVDPNSAAYAPEFDAMPPEGEQQEQPDYAAIAEEAQRRAEEAERRAEAAAQQAQAIQAQQQQVLYAQAQQAWKQKEAQLAERIQDYDQQTQIKIMQEFYNQRDAQKDQQYQQVLQFVTAQAYAEKLMQHYGLSQEDRVLLGQDPNAMPHIAAKIKADRDRYEGLIAEQQRGRRAQQALQTVNNGINQIGGVNARPAPLPDNIEKGSKGHLSALLNDPGNLSRVGGRR
jgi:hypothetical protein